MGFFAMLSSLWFTFSKSTKQQNSALLDLPLEIIDAIVVELDLTASTVLSQTCQCLWRHLHNDTAHQLRELTVESRQNIRAQLGGLLPDSCFCTTCGSLHRVNTNDLPWINPGEYINKPCPREEPIDSRIHWNFRYAIAFRHVQSAIKYTQCDNLHRRYAGRIMRKVAFDAWKAELVWVRFTAQPLIIESRFLVKTTHVFRCSRGPLTYSRLRKVSAKFCPHYGFGEARVYLGGVLTAVEPLFEAFDAGVKLAPKLFSCDRCPTDFALTIDARAMIVEVWSDLGGGASPSDPFWSTHVPTTRNCFFNSTGFDYKPGSVEAAYSRSSEDHNDIESLSAKLLLAFK